MSQVLILYEVLPESKATRTMYNLGTLTTDKSGYDSYASSINDRGQVCGGFGYYENGLWTGYRSFVYDLSTGTMYNLGSLTTDRTGHGNSVAYSINERGQVCGFFDYYENGVGLGFRGFVYDPVLHGVDMLDYPNWDAVVETFHPQFVITPAWRGLHRNGQAERILRDAPDDLLKAAYCELNFNDQADLRLNPKEQTGYWQVQQ